MNAHNVFVALLLLPAALCMAQQTEIKKVPITHTNPTSGQEMYSAYCGSCHGMDGKGGGQAAKALKVPPPDLTTLAKRNNGVYPALHVAEIIRGDTASPIHDDNGMPIWGNAFRSLTPGTSMKADATVQMRISSLNNYIKSLQVK